MAETTPAPKALAPSSPPARETWKNASPEHHGSGAWIWIIAILAIVAIGSLVVFRRKKPATPPPRPTIISTTNAMTGNIDVSVTGLGIVTPIYTVGISPRVDGQLVNVNYLEGQLVQTNDLLAEIDPTPYQALLLEAQGSLARDAAQLEAAKIDLQRYQAAFDKHAIPEQQVADQKALMHQYEGTVQLDQGTVSNAQVQVNYCYVRAPISGRVGLRLVDPGNIVHAANTNAMVVIAQLQPITVVFSVAEDYLPQIMKQLQAHHAMRVEAYDRDLSTLLATGTFLTMDNLIDTTTGTIRIKAVFQNEDYGLFPNQFVNAKLIIDTLHDITLVPTPTIQRNPQGAFVYIVTNGAPNTADATNKFVAMAPITVGVSDTNVTQIEGLEAGDSIASDNFNKLEDGMKVVVRQGGSEGGTRGQGGGRGGAGKKHGGKREKGDKQDKEKQEKPQDTAP